MAYKLFDKEGKEISFHDLQDKGPWCEHGVTKEEVFVKKYGEICKVAINPQKKEDKYAPDLISTENSRLADLKTQNTPFFQAKQRFKIEPQFAVVFNHKDRERYKNKYPDIDIYFWADWNALRFEHVNGNVNVEPMEGVWKISFQELDKLLESAPLHSYSQRRDDTKGNAKDSYVLDLSNKTFVRII